MQAFILTYFWYFNVHLLNDTSDNALHLAPLYPTNTNLCENNLSCTAQVLYRSVVT